MGYEVIVTGHIKFKDVDGFKKEFAEINKHKESEHGPVDYFFTKMWGDNLEDLDAELNEDGSVEISREGKLWYDEEAAMEFLAKYAYGTIESVGEDNERWRYVISENGTVKHQRGENVWVD